MKFGVREICEVVLKAKATHKVGNKIFYKIEPVIYFDSIKTSSMEGAATTVYAQGGRGNSRLIAWEGERTVTFTMEDALISAEGFMILSGAGLVEAASDKPIYQHIVETTDDFKITKAEDGEIVNIDITLKHPAYLPADKNDNFCYVMLMKDGEVFGEPIIPHHAGSDSDLTIPETKTLSIKAENLAIGTTSNYHLTKDVLADIEKVDAILVDYYTARTSNAKQIEITPDKFGGNYYLEASTLFRNTNGVDMPAEFIVPNCKIQSNFNFTMASSGDPSTFTFTMDAFPDYTRFDKTKKVLAAIQIIDLLEDDENNVRTQTMHDPKHESIFD